MMTGAKEAKGNYAFANQQKLNNMHAMAATGVSMGNMSHGGMRVMGE